MLYECAHPCTSMHLHMHAPSCIHMYTCSQARRHMHTYTCAYPCVTWLSQKDLRCCLSSFYRPLGLFLSICTDIQKEGNLECVVVGQMGEQSSYTQSVTQEHVCACTPMHMYTEGPVGVYMYIPVCTCAQLSAWLVSGVCGTESLCLCASVSLDIFWCLAIPVM